MEGNVAGGLGIQKLDVREAWAHEAAHFAPLLADHSGDLGDVLGLDLEVASREAAVGTFSLDSLARDAGTGGTEIVENQLQSTGHDHLGKPFTYEGGHEAIARRALVREEFT